MTEPRENTRALKGPNWKKLATLGDVYRGLRSVVLKMNAGRLSPDTGRGMIAGLSKLGDLYTQRLERLRGMPKTDETERPLRELADDAIDQLAAQPPH